MIRFLFFLLFLPLAALADISLVYWQPAGYPRAYLLIAREGETPAAARERYLKTLEADPELKPFAQELRRAGAGKVGKFESPSEPFVAVLANDTLDLRPSQNRILRVSDPLAKRAPR